MKKLFNYSCQFNSNKHTINDILLPANIMAFLFCIFLPFAALSQNNELDSLIAALPQMEQNEQKGFVLLRIGELYARSDLEITKDYFRQALHVSKQISNEQLEANSHKSLGVGHIMASNLDSSWIHYNLADKIYRKWSKDGLIENNSWAIEGYIGNLTNIGNWFYYNNQFDSVILYHERVLNLCEKHEKDSIGGLEYLKSSSLNMLGNIYFNRGNFDKALETYLAALANFEKTNSLPGQARIYQEIGNLYSHYNHDNEKSLNYYRKSFLIKKGLQDPRSLAWSQAYLGGVFVNLMQYDSAAYYLSACRDFAEFQNDSRLQSIYYKAYAKLLLKTERPLKEIKEACEKWLKISEKSNNKLGLTEANKMLASAHLKDDKFNEAITYGEKSIAINETGNELSFLSEVRKIIYESYKGLGTNDTKTLAAYENYIAARDSISNRETIDKIESLAVQYETEKKEELITLQQDRLSRQRTIQLLSFGFVALLSALLILLYRNFRLKQKTNTKLALANDQLADKNKENELLLKEIHHRVKNNLQTVSSLLSLQSRSISDKTALDAVQESKNRVASMAMIHQKLYQRDNLAAIEMRDYFETIGKAIINSFGEKAKNVDLDIQMNEFELDVDTAVPIGLIANELITNSLKHAFPNNEGGMVSITLSEEDNLIKLTIADNGKGVPQPSSESIKRGFGTQLVQLLTAQLDGKIDRSTTDGTSTVILFSLPDKSVA